MFDEFLTKLNKTFSQEAQQPPAVTDQRHQKVRIWGDFNFHFRFHTQGESLYQTGILYAKGERAPGIQVPLLCKWFRIKHDERSYEIPEINTNVYQLSAEDIGCKIRVEATPIDDDEFTGRAYGEFGPIELDPAARQTLEYVLGTGGSQFPISVMFQGGGHKKEQDDVEQLEANLFVTSTVIKLCFVDSFGGTAHDDAISLKYTIDYPKIELHPFDTQRFKLYYSDDKVDAKYQFDKCIEIKALSRQSRDLIALAIKCFSAHTQNPVCEVRGIK